MMGKRRIGLLVLFRQRDPRLDAMHRATLGASPLEPFGVRDAAPGRHPVHFSRKDRLLGAETVAMHDLAREKVRECREPDVRVRPHVDAARQAARKLHGSHMIEEDERSYHLRFAWGSTRPTSKPPKSRRR